MNQKIGVVVDTENDNDLPVANITSDGLVSDVISKEAFPVKCKNLNIEGIEDVARYIEKNGSFADENRNW